MPYRSTLVSVVFLAVVSAPAAAQSRQQTADDKEVYAYVLTMDGLRKMMRATQAMYAELSKDPKFKQMAALDAEIKSLEEKEAKLDDGLPEAELERLEALRAQREQLEDSTAGPLDNAKTLSEMEAAVRKTPVLATALQREGIPARDYAKFWIVFWSAGFAHGMQKEGYGSKEMSTIVNPANLKFFQEHEKEIEAVMKEHEFVKPKR